MCGIGGILYSNRSVAKSDLQILTDQLAHRGPDDQGTQILDDVGLAHCRLSIIDLSKKGHQPMSDRSKDYWITFNGEIYNFQEIRDQLIKKGYKFNSQTDTEVIINSYIEYGTDCLKLFRGMFAFAIYDRKKKLLFAARDRLGKKPFKYFFDGESFIFASELKAILKVIPKTPEVDQDAIQKYLYWGFIPSPQTGFKDIFKLPAGNYLIYQNKKVTIHKYWDYPLDFVDRSEEETIHKLKELVKESVRLRMISDVPIGAFLSGGIDSCVIVGLMSQLSPQPINTYTIGFEGWSDNETDLARISSKFHKTNHHELFVKPNIHQILPKIAQAYDEPFGDVSAIPSYYVSQIASKKVKVVLNGDGGDELFLGYSNYTTLLLTQNLSKFQLIFKLLYPTLKPMQKAFYSQSFYQRLLRVSDLLKQNPKESYAKYARGYLNLVEFKNLFQSPSFDLNNELKKYLPENAPDLISKISYLDLHLILPDGLMTKMDIASMQFGLEARSPLLDHQLVEFAATIPSSLKTKNNQTKYIFKKAFADLIPEEIKNQPKRGFVLPIGKWLKEELKDLISEIIQNKNSHIYTVLDYQTVNQILKLHLTTNIDYSFLLWRILMLELWYREYVHNS